MEVEGMQVKSEVNMSMENRRKIVGIAMAVFLFGFAGISAATTNNANPAGSNKTPMSLADQIRHELLLLPYNGVFDQLRFALEDSNTVVLSGQVVRPLLKSDAEATVRRIQGVSKVENNIEVLPLSSLDETIRLATYKAIFSKPGFEKYTSQPIAPIRIIVKNGNVALEGVIGSEMDKTNAELAAKSVPGVFSVTDNLTIG
jgi:hyperosmotically inducible periplasmic protein